MRELFEKMFPPPDGVHWRHERDRYEGNEHTPVFDSYLYMWENFQSFCGYKHLEDAMSYKDDAMRYRWLKKNVTETLTENSLKGDFMFSEHKTQYVFPRLIAWADFCGPIPLDEAIDYKIEAELYQKAKQ